jgi:hypothetical protein
MRERLVLALRPWTYSDIGVLWFGLLALMAICIALQARGRMRSAHLAMAGVGLVLTGKLAVNLAWHYGRCTACSASFDVSPNASSWAFLYDYICCAIILAIFAVRESGRFALPRRARARWAAGMLVAPTVAAPLFFAELHALESAEKAPESSSRSWRPLYLVLVVVSAPFVMPALPVDHFGDLGGEFFWDGTSNQINSYVGLSVLLLFGQIFLFTLPRTRGFWLEVGGLFLAFNCLAAYFALWAASYDRRFTTEDRTRWHAFALRGAGGMIGAVLLGNAVAALFGVTLRTTHFVIKSPETVCAEGLATRTRSLPVCLGDLERAASARDAKASLPGANEFSRKLPEETGACIDLARSAMDAAGAGDEKQARELTRRLGTHHGSGIPSCQEAASANYAVLNECPEL